MSELLLAAVLGAVALVLLVCDLFLCAWLYRALWERDEAQRERDRALRAAHNGLGAMRDAIRANEETLRHAPRP